MRWIALLPALLAGCGETATTAEGCPIYISEYGQRLTQSCQQAFYEERARQTGGTVTKCFGGPGEVTCVSE